MSAATATDVATELAGMASEHGVPYLQRLAQDHDRLAAELRVDNALGMARKVVLLAMDGRSREASTALQECLGNLDGRTVAAAAQQRETGMRLTEWLSAPAGKCRRPRGGPS